MKGIIFDLELVNSGKEDEQIIEIGACLVNYKSRVILAEYQTFCKLPEGIPLDPVIAKLCQITEEQVNAGVDAAEGIRGFWEFIVANSAQGSVGFWGPDLRIIRKHSDVLGIAVPPRIAGIDLKSMARLLAARTGSSSAKGLRGHMQLYGLDFEGEQHRALTDSRNTVRLLFRWLKNFEMFGSIQNVLTSTPDSHKAKERHRGSAIGYAAPKVVENFAAQILEGLTPQTEEALEIPEEFDYKGNRYHVVGETKLRLESGAWVDGVVYTNREKPDNPLYTRTLSDFRAMMLSTLYAAVQKQSKI